MNCVSHYSGDIEVDQPIMSVSVKIGICIVGKEGKPSQTVFKKISYNGTTSLVHCFPTTGRMHQIRLHLQYLGYPIINDPIYNSFSFGKTRGKNGDYGVSHEEV